jgi:hypothetical protein
MSASEWIAVPGAAGAAVMPTTDARRKVLDPQEFDLGETDGAAPLDVERGRAWISGFR